MVDKFDGELTVGSIVGVKKIRILPRRDGSFRAQACGTALPHKNERYGRCIRGKGYCQEGVSVGHPAIAITDHGVVQSFPDANHLLDDLWKAEKEKRKAAGDENPDRNDFFKVIYGCEA